MHILIIGGTGVLSSAVCEEALKRGIKVTMINRGNRKIPSKVYHIQSDRRDYHRISQALLGKKFDAVMDFLLTNPNDTRRSIEFYTKYTKQFFYISSCSVYNTAKLAGKMGDEDSPKELSIWDYSVQKWASEKLVMELFDKIDANYTIIRPCVTYGDTRIPYGISPLYGYHWTLAARILSGKPIIIWNKGINRCNMTRVEDFAIGVVGLIGNPRAYNEAFNVCGDETPSYNDVLDVISHYLNKEILKVDIDSEFYAREIPTRAGELLGGRSIDSINSNNKLKAVVPEFSPSITLNEGVFKTLDAYKYNNFQNGIDWNFDGDCDRVIRKWCKEKQIDISNMNLSFVDYLGNSSFNDRMMYWKAVNVNKHYYNIRKLASSIKRLL